jgi:hypothetical protein
MNIPERICQEAYQLPEPLAREVLDFIDYLKQKHGMHVSDTAHLEQAQMTVMRRIWDNDEDEAWNDL